MRRVAVPVPDPNTINNNASLSLPSSSSLLFARLPPPSTPIRPTTTRPAPIRPTPTTTTRSIRYAFLALCVLCGLVVGWQHYETTTTFIWATSPSTHPLLWAIPLMITTTTDRSFSASLSSSSSQHDATIGTWNQWPLTATTTTTVSSTTTTAIRTTPSSTTKLHSSISSSGGHTYCVGTTPTGAINPDPQLMLWSPAGGGSGAGDDQDPKQQQQQETVDHDTTDWMFRTCLIDHLCYDTVTETYVRLADDDNNGGSSNSNNNNNANGNSRDGDSLDIALGGINPRWAMERGFDKGIWKVRWKIPTITMTTAETTVALLPDHVVWMPFHSMAGHNVGHLLWDDFFSLYTALSMFGLLDNDENNKRGGSSDNDAVIKVGAINSNEEVRSGSHRTSHWFLTRHAISLNDNRTLYATCDIRRNKRLQCKDNFQRFLPLVGVHPDTFSTQRTMTVQWTNTTSMTATAGSANRNVSQEPQQQQQQQARLDAMVDHHHHRHPRYLCAKQAVVGIGLLTDHGLHDHGWDANHVIRRDSPVTTINPNPYHDKGQVQQQQQQQQLLPPKRIPHTIGRARDFYEFGRFLLRNIGIQEQQQQQNPQQQQQSILHRNDNDDTNDSRKKKTTRITLNLLSSRDWDRRLDFVAHIAALHPTSTFWNRNNNHMPSITIRAVPFWNLTITEQIHLVAMQTDILITACGGGGSVLVSFLSPGSAAIIFYNATGGYNFGGATTTSSSSSTSSSTSSLSFMSNGAAARLDSDLLNHAAAGQSRIHWLPIVGTMNNDPAHLTLFVRLIEHEIAFMNG